MGRASREKGKRGEREFVHALRALGIDARRTQQFSGKAGDADVDSELEGIHWEVKRRTSIAATRFLEQADADRKENQSPVVAMREDRGPWMILLKLDDLETLARTLVDALGTSPITSHTSSSSHDDEPPGFPRTIRTKSSPSSSSRPIDSSERSTTPAKAPSRPSSPSSSPAE
jgi:Holliday junction resolvase